MNPIERERRQMPRLRSGPPKYASVLFNLVAMVILILMIVVRVAQGSIMDSNTQKTFSSPEQAIAALVSALQQDDDAELLAILGSGAEDLISSGDSVADRNGRVRFLKAYAEKFAVEAQGEDQALFLIGVKDYPFPIPIIRREEGWMFDTQAGKEEILNRRIGKNELNALEVMQAYTDAQREYACLVRPEQQTQFAQKFASSEGKRDGLYWEVGEDGKESPFGPLIARATEKGYRSDLDENPAEPYRGYYYKIIKAQGEHAVGGAFDYVIDGKMVLGFALTAYPARYGVSGIMTFIVNQEGIIYEKDLGENTVTIAEAMTSFDPDKSWRMHEEPVEK